MNENSKENNENSKKILYLRTYKDNPKNEEFIKNLFLNSSFFEIKKIKDPITKESKKYVSFLGYVASKEKNSTHNGIYEFCSLNKYLVEVDIVWENILRIKNILKLPKPNFFDFEEMLYEQEITEIIPFNSFCFENWKNKDVKNVHSNICEVFEEIGINDKYIKCSSDISELNKNKNYICEIPKDTDLTTLSQGLYFVKF